MKDFLTDNDGDLIIENGHFKIGDCTAQNQRSLLLASKGENRQFPYVGVDLEKYIEDDDLQGLELEIRKQFELDGMNVMKLKVLEGGDISFKAPYDQNKG